MVGDPHARITRGPDSILVHPADTRLTAGIVAGVVHQDAPAALDAGDLQEGPLRQTGERHGVVVWARPECCGFVRLHPDGQRRAGIGVDGRHFPRWRRIYRVDRPNVHPTVARHAQQAVADVVDGQASVAGWACHAEVAAFWNIGEG